MIKKNQVSALHEVKSQERTNSARSTVGERCAARPFYLSIEIAQRTRVPRDVRTSTDRRPAANLWQKKKKKKQVGAGFHSGILKRKHHVVRWPYKQTYLFKPIFNSIFVIYNRVSIIGRCFVLVVNDLETLYFSIFK